MSRHKSVFPEETSRSLHRGITYSLSLRNIIPLQEGMSEKCFPSLNPLPPHLTDLSGTKSTTDSFASGYGICGNGNQHQGHTSPQSTRLMKNLYTAHYISNESNSAVIWKEIDPE